MPRLRRRRRWWLYLGVAWLALAVVFGAFLVQDLLSHTPGRLSLPTVGASGPLATGPVSGTWTVAPGSRVGYRVHEILFGLHHTAVGRTSEVTGGMTVSGRQVVAAEFTVQMASVQTDQAGREVMWRDFIMNTGAYPQARFRLTQPIDLGAVPAIGRVISVPATGQLTMRGETRVIHFTIRGERVSAGTIDLNAGIPIAYARWRIPNPSFAITRVADTGTLEVLLRLTRGGRG
ncbi:MAG: YceI family protein [Acidimicrobiales bacterium]